MDLVTNVGSAGKGQHPVPSGVRGVPGKATPAVPYAWPDFEPVDLESARLGTPVDPARELRLDDLRLRIAAGRYLTADKLNVVAQRVLEELKRDG